MPLVGVFYVDRCARGIVGVVEIGRRAGVGDALECSVIKFRSTQFGRTAPATDDAAGCGAVKSTCPRR